MTATQSPLLSPEIRSQAWQFLNEVGIRFQNTVDNLNITLNTIGTTYRAFNYGLRQEVPFERWFFDHGFQQPIDNHSALMKARAWAALAVCEGAIKTMAEVASYLYSKIFKPQQSERHLEVLNAQWQGFTLSLLAVISPNLAKEMAHAEGTPIIGASPLNWRWGTLYTGTLDVPLWHIECLQYPWDDRPIEG